MVNNEELKRYYADNGLSIREIAMKEDMPFQTVRRHLLKAGITFRKKPDYRGRHTGPRMDASEYMPVIRNMVALGKTDVDIGRALHARPQTVSQWRTKAGIEPAAKKYRKLNLDNLKIKELLDAGVSIREAASRLSCSYESICRHSRDIRTGAMNRPETDIHAVNCRILAMAPVKDTADCGFVPHFMSTEAHQLAMRVAKENQRRMRQEAVLQRKEKRHADEMFAKASVHTLLSAEDLSSIAHKKTGKNRLIVLPSSIEPA